MSNTKPITASRISSAAVSRCLRKGGLLPVPSGSPRSREGIRVAGARGVSTIYVRISVDSKRISAQLAVDAAYLLNEAGYNVSPVSENILAVTAAREVRS